MGWQNWMTKYRHALYVFLLHAVIPSWTYIACICFLNWSGENGQDSENASSSQWSWECLSSFFPGNSSSRFHAWVTLLLFRFYMSKDVLHSCISLIILASWFMHGSFFFNMRRALCGHCCWSTCPRGASARDEFSLEARCLVNMFVHVCMHAMHVWAHFVHSGIVKHCTL